MKAVAAKCCAICAADIRAGEEHTAPLGKNDALVAICASCDDEPARRVHGTERGYEAPNTAGCFGNAVTNATERLVGLVDLKVTLGPKRFSLTPGYVLVRVPQKLDGKARDQREAWQTFQHEPWAPEVKYLGCFRRCYVWERPDAEALAELRRAKDADALHGIEMYRVRS